jgi:hypothetical protein
MVARRGRREEQGHNTEEADGGRNGGPAVASREPHKGDERREQDHRLDTRDPENLQGGCIEERVRIQRRIENEQATKERIEGLKTRRERVLQAQAGNQMIAEDGAEKVLIGQPRMATLAAITPAITIEPANTTLHSARQAK